METTASPVYYTKSNDDKFFRKQHNSTVAFAIGLLLFLLPFAQLRCADMTLMSNSGVGLAIGSEWKVAMGGNKMFDKMNSRVKDKEAPKALTSGPNIFMLVAIAAAIFGLAIGFSEQKWKDTASMCAGVLAALMLIAVMIQLKLSMRTALTESKEEQLEAGVAQMLKMKFTIWYYLSLLAFGCAAFFSFKRNKIEMQDALARFSDFEFQHQDRPA